MKHFQLDVDGDGVALVTFAQEGKSQNVWSDETVTEFIALVDKLAGDAKVKAVVVTGTDKSFCAGADIAMLAKLSGAVHGAKTEADKKALFDQAFALNAALRKFETMEKPTAAAISGQCQGGGYELALACHIRIAADDDKIRIGLPETKIGMFPGGGGTQRLPRLIGVQAAAPYILQGDVVVPQKALKDGLIDAVVPREQLIAEAKKAVLAAPEPKAPWDRKGHKIPGGGPFHPVGIQNFMVGNAMLRKQTSGNYPAARFAMQSVYEGLQVPMEAALRIETRYFLRNLETDAAKGMSRTFFASLNELNKGARRPADVPASTVKKLGVLGAGLMGAGVAYVSAKAGMEVVLLDVNKANAEKGKDYSVKILDKALSRGKIDEAEKNSVLNRITPTDDYADIKGCDFIVEAVFEREDIKEDVIGKAEAVLGADAIFGSNTSTIPITTLAQYSKRPESFIGVHFFSPVEKMPLVELIKGEKTSDEAVARALDYVAQIKKTPIVVNDSRGFYTSRCFSTYVNEGLIMLAEGVNPALIENCGRFAGMPMGPMEVGDSVGIDTMLKISRETFQAVGEKSGKDKDLIALLEKVVEGAGRVGRKAGEGFYDYKDGRPAGIWPEVYSMYPRAEIQPSAEEVKIRLMTIQALEALRCIEEGVVTDMREADIGAIFGWGFAPFTGGPISMVDALGTEAFLRRCEVLAAKHGERFKPNALLKELAATNATVYSKFNPEAEAAMAA